jgi:UPF0755 protein
MAIPKLNNKSTILLAVLLVVIIGGVFSARAVMPVGGRGDVFVEIPRHSSAERVAEILQEKKVVRSAFAFRLLARLARRSTALKPGAYQLSPSMSSLEIIRKISSGDVAARWVTVPEGFTIRQIAAHVEAEHLCNADDFLQKATTGGRAFKTDFPSPGANLEGYLFPDSYLIPVKSSDDAIIAAMLDCFSRKVSKPLGAEIAKSGMTMNQVITLASLIEKEAKVDKDRPLISAALRNRLAKHMRLDCDATVLYALGRHKKRVLYKDLRIDSPYNTYLNFGLPPGPIASPGLESIKAALHPASVDYLYYVAKPDGSHIFSRTMAEHERAKAEARRKDSGT